MSSQDTPQHVLNDDEALDVLWGRLNNGESFFVPCLDADTAKKKLLSRGYYPRKNAPEAIVGFFRGQWGVLCFRKADPAPRGQKPKQRVRKKRYDSDLT